MRFSVIIPLYNGAKYIAKTLDSVLAQTYKNFEIVLVNDGSPDNVGEVVKKYMGEHKDIKFVYVEQGNKGLGGARNTAIKHSSGEIIAVLDQDDIWYPKKLEIVDRAYKDFAGAGVVSHNINIIDGKSRKEFRTGPYSEDMLRFLLFTGNKLRTPSATFKRSVIEKVGLLNVGEILAWNKDKTLEYATSGKKLLAQCFSPVNEETLSSFLLT